MRTTGTALLVVMVALFMVTAATLVRGTVADHTFRLDFPEVAW